MSIKTLFAFFAFSLVFFFTGLLSAHPHVFVDARVSLLFDEKGLAGFRESWKFDEMFGQFILEDYDKNKNKRFEPDEVAKIKAEAFDNLKEFRYFHSVKLNGKPLKVEEVTDFTVKLIDGRVIYAFSVVCKAKVTEKAPLKVSFSLNDPTIYTDIGFTKDSPKLLGNEKRFNVEHKLDETTLGQLFAHTMHITVTER